MSILVIVFMIFPAYAQVMPFGGLLILVGGYDLIQLIKTRDKNLTWLGAFLRAYNPGGLQLIHDTAGLGVSHPETSLKVGSGASLAHNNQLGGLLKTFV